MNNSRDRKIMLYNRIIPILAFFMLVQCYSAAAADMVLNHGFETQETDGWVEYGSIPSYDRGVVRFDVTGNGIQSWTYYQHPGWDYDGGLQQTLYVEAGETYVVNADICYHSG